VLKESGSGGAHQSSQVQQEVWNSGPGQPWQKARPYCQNNQSKKSWRHGSCGVVHVVEHLPSNQWSPEFKHQYHQNPAQQNTQKSTSTVRPRYENSKEKKTARKRKDERWENMGIRNTFCFQEGKLQFYCRFISHIVKTLCMYIVYL
jgi:hypothetical protein